MEKTSDKKGVVSLMILDATQQYKVRVDKEGYAPFEGPLDPKPEDTMRVTFTLAKAAQAQPAEAAPQELSGKDKAIVAYNAGVDPLKAGDLAAALPHFEEAAALDPELAQAHAVVAEIYAEQGRHDDALAAADRYLALKPGDARGLRVRYDALKGKGDPAKAQEALDALIAADPANADNAVLVFNAAAAADKARDFDGAAALFTKVTQIAPEDQRFVIAHFQLGIYANNAGDKEKARQHLEKFLQVAPDNPNAETAKAILESLK
jgi:tetratricopeptide (TPR) repeat protein